MESGKSSCERDDCSRLEGCAGGKGEELLERDTGLRVLPSGGQNLEYEPSVVAPVGGRVGESPWEFGIGLRFCARKRHRCQGDDEPKSATHLVDP